MTTLEELLTMMAEDAAGAAAKQKRRPPPPPPKKADAIAAAEIDALDDGPVLEDGRFPSALARPARRGPPPPPPARRARGTEPIGEPISSGLIDVRAMAMAYQAEAARRSAPELALAPETQLAESSATVKLPEPAAEAAPTPAPAPTPIIAEGTRPFPAVSEETSEPAADEQPARRRAGLVWLFAHRAAVVLVLGGTAAAAVTVLVNRARSEQAVSDPTNYTARVAADEPPAAAPMPELAAPELPAPAIEPVVIVEPTTITEVSAPVAEPALASDPADVEVSAPAAAAAPRADGEPVGPGHPPAELLADGCFDAACSATATPVRRPRRAAEMISVPARLPVRPSNSEIASTIFAAQDQIDGCGAVYGVNGQVPLKIRIAASGAITSVAVGQGSTRFRTCVADIVRRLQMPASVVGTSASFPVLLR